MTDLDVIRRKRMEIRDKIEHLEEQICPYPPNKKRIQHNIKELQDELYELESECHRKTLNLELN